MEFLFYLTLLIAAIIWFFYYRVQPHWYTEKEEERILNFISLWLTWNRDYNRWEYIPPDLPDITMQSYGEQERWHRTVVKYLKYKKYKVRFKPDGKVYDLTPIKYDS